MQVREDDMVLDGCFGLARRPFAAVAQVERYFRAGAIEAARVSLARGIQRGEGAGLVIGPSGTGKTLLCMALAEQFRRTFQVGVLSCGRLSDRRALFQAILYELGRPWRGMDEGELRLAVVDHLCGTGLQSVQDHAHDSPAPATGGETERLGMVLLVDEAHTLPLRLLDEIRLLTNLARNGQPLVRVVLAGAPLLEERLANPRLDSLSQRLSTRCYLEAFNRTETQGYIQSQINWAGGEGGEIFPEAACQAVFRATGGVPRLINQVCDHSLLLVYVDGRQSVAPADVEEAWADLQQLPVPATAEAAASPGSQAVIEFGSLEDSTEPTAKRRSDSANPPAVFRVASLDGTSEPSDSDAAGQIHRIERLLSEADEGFQPAGSIGPEVELQWDQANHPFQEAFEQEEVVADRYAGKPSRNVRTTTTDQGSRETPCAEGFWDTASAGCTEPLPPALFQQPVVCMTGPVDPAADDNQCGVGPANRDSMGLPPAATQLAEPQSPEPRSIGLDSRAESLRDLDLPGELADRAESVPSTPCPEARPCDEPPLGSPHVKPIAYRRLFANLRRG